MQAEYAVIDIEPITRGVAALRLKAPKLAQECRPGQFAHFLCGKGMHSVLRRPLSISAVDGEEVRFLFQIKGEGTQWLASRTAADRIDVIAPLGKGCFTLPQTGNVLLAAGGIGIAPLFFLTQQAIQKGLKTTVLFGARTKDGLYCARELAALGAAVRTATEDGSAGEPGLITPLIEQELARASYQGVFSCGPAPMLKATAGIAKRFGVPVQVSMEEYMACGIGACRGCVVKVKNASGVHYENVCSKGPVFDGSEVFFDE